MSEFDKEAEREKLRKKLEKEEQDREATQRMSELLLKGATMTNVHCDVCGDPIFRSDGQEFCPTCQKPVVQEDDADTQTEAAQKEAHEEQETSIADEESVDIQINGATTQAGQESNQATTPTDTDPASTTSQQDLQRSSESETLGNSREQLIQLINSSIQQATESTDIQRSRDHLQLAKDAAETLRTLQGL